MSDTYFRILLGEGASESDGQQLVNGVNIAMGTFIVTGTDPAQQARINALSMSVNDNNDNGVLDGGDSLNVAIRPESPLWAGLLSGLQSSALSAVTGNELGAVSAIYSGISTGIDTATHTSDIDSSYEVGERFGRDQTFMSHIIYDPDPETPLDPSQGFSVSPMNFLENGMKEITLTANSGGEQVTVRLDADNNIVSLVNPVTGTEMSEIGRDAFEHGLPIDRLRREQDVSQER